MVPHIKGPQTVVPHVTIPIQLLYGCDRDEGDEGCTWMNASRQGEEDGFRFCRLCGLASGFVDGR